MAGEGVTRYAQMLYARKCHLWILLGVIQLTSSISSSIPGLDVDNTQTVCDNALNYASIPGGLVKVTSNQAPFTVQTDGREYLPDKSVRVTIRANSNTKIRGFTLQARQVSMTPTGHFSAKDNVLFQCVDVNDTIVAWYDTDQDSVSFTWKPPTSKIGSVTFVANVITGVKHVYPNITTKVIRRGFAEINMTGCGVTKGCYRYPEEHESTCTYGTCQYIVTYRRHEEVAYFELTAKAGWAAIGFSSDDKMGGDDVFMCVHQSPSGVAIRHYKNEIAYQTPHLQDDNSLIEQEVGTTSGDSHVACRFKRRMSFGEPHVDLNNDWFQLYAWGPLNGAHIGRHTLPKPPTSEIKIILSHKQNVIGGASRLNMHTLLMLPTALLAALYFIQPTHA